MLLAATAMERREDINFMHISGMTKERHACKILATWEAEASQPGQFSKTVSQNKK